MKFLWLTLYFAVPFAFAQMDTSEQNFTESKSILEKIKEDNDFRTGSVQFRTGLMSLSSNFGDPLKLNSKNQIPFLNVEADFELGNIARGVGINLEGTVGQNVLGGQKSNSANSASSQILFYQIGPRYRFILDESNIKNYFQIKLLYHSMSNNFKMTTVDSTADFAYPKSHTAFLLGFERSIPATTSYDFKAAFDFFYITDTKEIESTSAIEKTGRGIQLRGEGFYNLQKNSRIGIMYSLSHFVNKFTFQSAGDTGKSSSTHTYRYLGLSYSYLF